MLDLSLEPVSGSPTRVRVIASNPSAEAVRFLYWNTPFDPLCPMGLTVEADALPPAPYRGPRARYAFDPEVSLVTVPPAGRLEREVDVSTNYRLPATTTYTLGFEGTLRGVAGDALVDAPCNLSELETGSGRTELRLAAVSTDDLFPPAFPSAALQSDACDIPLCWNSYYEPPLTCVLGRARYAHARVEGGTAAQRTVVRRAVDRLFNHIALPGPYRLEVRDGPEYRRWFGAFTESRARLVRQAISGIRGQSVCKSFVIHILPGCINPDTIAMFRKPDADNRYGALGLCARYFRERETGFDSQAGTLAHELSHGYGDTVDHEYGVYCCQRLAARRPDLAVRNADSIQYYLEEILLSRPLTEEGLVLGSFDGAESGR